MGTGTGDSVTRWVARAREGDGEAVQALWERYYGQLVRLARRKLEGVPRRVADEEDVALSAFASFCKAAGQGRFPQVADRGDLWRLLLRMTARKAVDLVRYNLREKRRVLGESVLARKDGGSEKQGMAHVIGEAPSPQFTAAVAEATGNLLGLLEDEGLKALALAKLEGYTNEEIAARCGCSLRTIERKLAEIRKAWARSEPA